MVTGRPATRKYDQFEAGYHSRPRVSQQGALTGIATVEGVCYFGKGSKLNSANKTRAMCWRYSERRAAPPS
jgi:hypothetical protein